MFDPRHDLIEQVQQLPETSQRRVFQALRDRGVKFTENGNGVFFNLTLCEDAGVWDALRHIVDQESTVQRENAERESRLRAMQEVLRVGGDGSGGGAQEEVVPEAAAAASAPAARKSGATSARAKAGRSGASQKAAPAPPRDILAMLAK